MPRVRWGRLLAAAALAALFFGNRGFRALASNWLELRKLKREIAALDEEERRLAQRLKSIKGADADLERLARKELGFIRKGEVEYRFPPPIRREP